ncbi:uncharacterized protein LOC107042848 [Diachasma alloeum]|uniref:uncharacterized protein LOC107042848 n=1 Tax=Diachasma alloeum TaxID=454923 RepID=UPI0007382A58|nr:uncharacterized protein LOC107042848 [Diachasma alloeum]
MGSHIFPIIANIFMEQFENEALKSAAQNPAVVQVYGRYLCHLATCEDSSKLKFLEFLNAQHPSIKFTMEIEQNGCLTFLDVLVRRNEDGTLGHRVYGKPTHTDRALTIFQPSNVNSEVEQLETALSKSGYNIQEIRKVKRKQQIKLSSPQKEINLEENREKPKVPPSPT